MDTDEDVHEYVTFNHSEVNELFVDQVAAFAPREGRLLDIGAGPADIAILVAHRLPQLQIVAIDLSRRMLNCARENVARHGVGDRVQLRLADAKCTGFEADSFDMVICNSMIHHIPEPRAFFAEVRRIARPEAGLFLKDLHRPATEREHDELVEQYASDCTPYQRKAFADSLRAGLTVEEVTALCRDVGLEGARVRRCSDRHWSLERAAAAVPNATRDTFARPASAEG